MMKMKRILCLVLALVMLVGMFTVGASARGHHPSGKPGNGGGFDKSYTREVIFKFVCGEDLVDSKTLTVAKADSDTMTKLLNYCPEAPDGYTIASALSVYDKFGMLITNEKIDNIYSKFTVIVPVKVIVPEKEEPTTYTIKFDKNSAAAEGAMDPQIVEVNKNASLKEMTFKLDGYSFIGWCIDPSGNSTIYEDKGTIFALANGGGEITLYAQWKQNPPVEDDDDQDDPTEESIAVPHSIYGWYQNAISASCKKDHHDAKAYSFKISNADQVHMVSETKALVYLSDENISAILAKYNDDTDSKHTFNFKARPAVAIVLEKSCYPRGGWKVTQAADLEFDCDCKTCHDFCGGWWHKHTVTYTDGVKNAVIFKDITYTVKNGAKTPVPANPTRAGYKFAGWSPVVAPKTTKCVTYVAQWTAATTPALTTKHVAYLKGYGGGLVKPEGNITRAEAITMLYRLMDAATVKEFYTTYNAFSDVAKDAWYNEAVSTMANAGILRYTTGKLNPNEAITRAEFFYMLTKFSNKTYTGKATFVDVPANYWAYEELALAQYLGWIKGYGGGVLNPDDTITRAEVAASLNRVLGRTTCKVKDTKSFSDNPVTAWYYQDIVEASIAH